MTTPTASFNSDPPQIGRPVALNEAVGERGLWSQLLTAFRDLSGAFDAFANDADPQVRALGRAARQRRAPQANDYFAIGDMCARLTLQSDVISETYAAKSLAAYARGADISAADALTARRAMLAYTVWVSEVAQAIGSSAALNSGALVCSRMLALMGDGDDAVEHVYAHERQLRALLSNQQVAEATSSAQPEVQRESRALYEQGQMLLRQGQPQPAFDLFERAVSTDAENHAAWLWRAMALTDLGRFDDALASYDRALALEPESAGVWNNKGSLLMESGRLDAALDCFERAIALSTAVPSVKALYWLNKGKALYMLAHYDTARAALTHAHELDPSPESGAGIAACYERIELQRNTDNP